MEVLYQLSYRGIFSAWGREDSNLRRRSRQIYSLLPLAARAHPRSTLTERPDMVANVPDISTEGNGPRARPQPEPGKGFEPPTGRLQGGCSTSELPGQAAAGDAPHAGYAALACQHVPAFNLHIQHASDLRSSLSVESLAKPARRHAPHTPESVTAQTPHRYRHYSLAESGGRRSEHAKRRHRRRFGVSLLACARFLTITGLRRGTFAGRWGFSSRPAARPGGSRTRAGWRGSSRGRGRCVAGRSRRCKRWLCLRGWRGGVL